MMIIGGNHYAAIGLFTSCGLMLLGLLATCPAVIAYEKKRSFLAWYVFGVFLLPVALVASFLLKKPTPAEQPLPQS